MTDLVSIGFKAESKGISKASSELDKLSKSGGSADRSINKLDSDTKKLSQTQRIQAQTTREAEKALAAKSRQAGQAGIQFQQFIGQIQGGQAPLVAFSQQAADLGIVLGAPLLGAIAGIAGSLSGIFLAAITQSEKATTSLIDKIKELRDETKLSASEAAVLINAEEDRRDEAAKTIAEQQKVIASLEKQEAAQEKLILKLDKQREAWIAQGRTTKDISSSINELSRQYGVLDRDIEKTSRELETARATQEVARKEIEDSTAKITLYNESIGKTSKELEKQKESSADLIDATQAVTDTLFAQIIALEQGEEAALRYSIAQRLGLESAEKIPKALSDQIEHLMMLKDWQEEASQAEKIAAKQSAKIEKEKQDRAKKQEQLIRKQRSDFKSLIDDVNNFGGAWTRTGNIIADSMGTAADALTDFSSRMDKLSDLQVKIESQEATTTGQRLDKIKALQKIEDERVNAQLSGLSSIAGAASQMFSEQSKGRKALHNAEKAFAAVEIALALKKASANALTAISSAFAAPFPVNFAAGAAMIGIMQGLGLFGGSGGSSAPTSEDAQKTQGTGTVLGAGDEKTESIVNSLDIISDTNVESLAELINLNKAINELSRGISSLASGFVRGGVSGANVDLTDSAFSIGSNEFVNSILGVFGNVKKDLINSGIAFFSQYFNELVDGVDAQLFSDVRRKEKAFGITISDKVKRTFEQLDDSFANEIENVFGFIGSSIVEAGDVLGISVADRLNNTIIKGFELSLKDLSGEEIEKELQAVFGEQADLLAVAALPMVSAFQRLGEGAFETLQRLAVEQTVFIDSLDSFGMSLSGTAEQLILIGQDTIEAAGGFEQFRQSSDSFFNEFFSEADKFNKLQGDITGVFDELGLSIVNSKEEFKNIVTGLDLTTESGQELFATLLNLSPALAEYLEQVEEIETKRTELTIQLLRLQGDEEKALAMERQQRIDSLNDELVPLQQLIFAEQDRIKAIEDQESAIEEIKRKEEELAQERLDLANRTFAVLERSIDAERSRQQAILDTARESFNAESLRITGLRESLNDEKALRDKALTDSENALRASFNAEIKLISDASKVQVDALNNQRNAANAAVSAMSSLIDGISGSVDPAQSLSDALQAARRGDFSLAQALDIGALASIGSTGFSSAVDMRRQQAINLNRLSTIRDLAKDQLSDAEKTLRSIDRQTNSIEETSKIEQSLLTEQLNNLLGIDNTVLSLDEAIKQYQSAQLSLDSLNYEKELNILEMMEQSNQDTFDLHQKAYNDEINRLDSILAANERTIDAVNGVDNSIKDISQALRDFSVASSDVFFTDEERAYNQEQADLDDYYSYLSQESIIKKQPTAFNPVIRDNTNNSNILRDTSKTNAMLMEVVKSTKQTAKILQRFELDGIDTRAIN